MIDIANGVFDSLDIVAPLNLNGSPPARAGDETVKKLAEMGLLDAQRLDDLAAALRSVIFTRARLPRGAARRPSLALARSRP